MVEQSFAHVLNSFAHSQYYDGAIPGVSYINRGPTDMATFHLTRHSAAILANSAKNAAAASEIRISAVCQLLSDDAKDNPASAPLNFRFIQFFYLADQRAFYAGSTAADGQMYLDFARAPAFSGENELMLDSESKSDDFPFYDMYRPRFQRVGPGLWMVTIVMDDHPFNDLPLAFPNPASGKTNFLCTASKRFEVVTTVVCRYTTNPAKPRRTMLGKISWGAEVACKIRWSKAGNDINPRTPEFTAREFHCSEPVPGADADLAAQIDALDMYTPTFNDAAENAFKTVMGNGPVSLRNVHATEKWHSAKVGDFFR